MQAPPVLSAAAAEGGESECWDPILDRATGAIYYHNPATGATRWHCEPLAKPQQQLRQLQQQLLSEPYPQVIDAGADLLAVSYPQMPDDSKPDVADHQFVLPEPTVLQAPCQHVLVQPRAERSGGVGGVVGISSREY